MTVMTSELQPSSAATLEELDRRHIIHPNLAHDTGERTVIVRGEGCRVWDASGRELLDATGGLWLCQIGHGRAEMAEIAAEQIATIEYFMSFGQFSNAAAIQLAAKLVQLAPAGLGRVFFTNGGSEGNETAIKAARLYHSRRGEPERSWVLSRRCGYHGVFYGSGTLTGFDAYHDGFGPELPNIARLTPPWPYRSELYDGRDPSDYLIDELRQTIERIGPDRVAAMIGEPIMGVGGVLVPPPDYWRRVRRLLSEYGILLIADEVITGYGRTGVWFASADEQMDADIVVTAKGITSGYAPLGAVLMTDQVGEVIAGGEGFHHGCTYFGHPLSCALALKNLAIIEAEELVARSRTAGAKLMQLLAPVRKLPLVGELRGRGLMIGIELVGGQQACEPSAAASEVALRLRRKYGVIVRDIGPVVALSPPLVLSDAQAQQIADAVITVMSELSQSPAITADGAGATFAGHSSTSALVQR